VSTSSLVIRQPANAEEIAAHFKWDYITFRHEDNPEGIAQEQHVIMSMPGFSVEQMRSVFLDGELVGGCMVFERKLHIGGARVFVGCIGGVFTRPEYRQQRIATLLMQDTIEFARARNYALLLLDGIPKFYYRYGYCDIFDVSIQNIVRDALQALPASPYTVRPATVEDAEQVLALYNHHYGAYTGSFTRSVELQRYYLQYRFGVWSDTRNPWRLAIDADNQPRGYLALDPAPEQRAVALELAADDWCATVALLQHHAHLLDVPDAPDALRYFLPGDAPVVQWLVDHLDVPDTAAAQHPQLRWAVLDQTYRYRYSAWMARIIHLTELARAMLPEWQARWHRSLASWSGDIVLSIGEESVALRIADRDLQLLEQASDATKTLSMTPQAFVQVLFGYRSITWAARQSAQSLDDELQTVLTILFPPGNTWIARSDWF
jgi:GNAT superfamily N-acetyltransferase